MFGLALIEILIMLALPVIVIGGVVVFVARALRSGNGNGGGPALPRGDRTVAALEERTARLEEALEATQTQLSRLAEGQEFTNKLLSERRDK